MNNKFVKEYFSIPNIMGYFRLILAAVYVWLFVNALHGGAYWPVIVVILISGLTDFFDGKIARKFNMVTKWGKILDPIADKVTLGAIIVSLALKYKIVIVLLGLYIVKEGFMGIVGLISIKKNMEIQGAMWYGKVCTFVTYFVFIILLIFPKMPRLWVDIIIIADMVLMAFTMIMYVVYYTKRFHEEVKAIS